MFSKTLVSATAILVTLSTAAFAQSPTRMNQHNAWGAYSYDGSNGKVCYVLSVPTSSEPASVNHGDNFFLISQRPGQNVSYEPQAMMGYPLREESKVNVTVDGRQFTLFTRGNSAWVENAAEEPTLISAMRAGSSMTVSATSGRGTATTYSYSLSGVTAALNEIQNCQ
jgi:hypothetical protein